ncbi:MAG: hypothetical protein DHS20C18_33810 [Saprospiraceae bacterium]|nr:MAG: hypothetical protein DHS20C18_33810 [Saprospiraceae bacterium]
MKKLYIIFLGLFLVNALMAQISFSDDFESYTVDAYLAASSSDWTTWTNSPGSSEDVRISDEQAASGTKSLKFVAGAAGGGPADVILKFGDVYEEGDFEFELNMFVVSGTGAYFNFQGADPPGSIWALEFAFNDNGNILISNNGGTLLETSYTHDTWFNFRIVVDLTNNLWTIYMDDVEQGSFGNSINVLASLDLFPFNGNGNGTSTFYVDDVSFGYEPYVQPGLDVGVINVSLGGVKKLVGAPVIVSGEVKNQGMDVVNSFDITWGDGSNSHTESYTDLNLASLATFNFQHPVPLTVLEDENTVTVTVSNVNGQDDDDPDNDNRVVNLTGVVPAPGKHVVVEEGTGTWCQWCPRGAVFMDFMTVNYPDYFVGIAVHNNDPMEVTEYDNGVSTFPGFTGYPGIIVDRINVLDPLEIEDGFFDEIIKAPVATLTNGAEYNPDTRELQLSVTAEFNTAVSGNYRLNMVIIEDGVTGTSSAYNQINAYAGGGNGPMGGYENLPSSVPASMMVYDHVARAILGGFAGLPGSLPTSIETGEIYSNFFSYEIPAGYEYDEIQIIGILIAPDGHIENATEVTIDGAIANGLAVGTDDPAITENDVQVSPNPFREMTTIRINIAERAAVNIQVLNTLGQVVSSQNYGELFGQIDFPIHANQMDNGLYTVRIQVGNDVVSKKIILSR